MQNVFILERDGRGVAILFPTAAVAHRFQQHKELTYAVREMQFSEVAPWLEGLQKQGIKDVSISPPTEVEPNDMPVIPIQAALFLFRFWSI